MCDGDWRFDWRFVAYISDLIRSHYCVHTAVKNQVLISEVFQFVTVLCECTQTYTEPLSPIYSLIYCFCSTILCVESARRGSSWISSRERRMRSGSWTTCSTGRWRRSCTRRNTTDQWESPRRRRRWVQPQHQFIHYIHFRHASSLLIQCVFFLFTNVYIVNLILKTILKLYRNTCWIIL